MDHTGKLSVLKERLPPFHLITLLDDKARLHAGKVISQDGYVGHGLRVADLLFWGSRDRKVETPFGLMQTHDSLSLANCAGIPGPNKHRERGVPGECRDVSSPDRRKLRPLRPGVLPTPCPPASCSRDNRHPRVSLRANLLSTGLKSQSEWKSR